MNPNDPALCEQCGGEFNPLTSYDHALCNACFIVSDLVDDTFYEDDLFEDDDYEGEDA